VSVTLKYCDQIGHNTSKIIPRLISLVFSVCRGTTMSQIYLKKLVACFANTKLNRTASASHGFLTAARLSCTTSISNAIDLNTQFQNVTQHLGIYTQLKLIANSGC